MNPLEERLNQLETRVTRYRNFNILLCLLLVAIVTVAATDGISPLQAGSAPEPIAMPEGNVGVPDLPDERIMMYLEAHRAGKVVAQTYDVIRTRNLQIVNDAGEVVISLGSTPFGGLISVEGFIVMNLLSPEAGTLFLGSSISLNSPEGKKLVHIGSSASSGDGLVLINSTEEKNQITLGSNSETGDGLIHIRNRNEERLIGLSATESSGWIRIDKTGNENLAYLGASTTGDGLLSLSNKSGKRLVSMFAEDMSGHLQLWNNNDKTIAYLGTYSAYLGTHSDGSGVLEIFSKTGTELITAGSNTNDNGLIRVSNSYGTLGVWIVGANEHGYVGIQNAQERLLAEMTAAAGGNGLVRTLSPEGITTWSSNSVQVNTGSSLKGDMDNDGDIDGDDFLIFSENFGKKR